MSNYVSGKSDLRGMNQDQEDPTVNDLGRLVSRKLEILLKTFNSNFGEGAVVKF